MSLKDLSSFSILVDSYDYTKPVLLVSSHLISVFFVAHKRSPFLLVLWLCLLDELYSVNEIFLFYSTPDGCSAWNIAPFLNCHGVCSHMFFCLCPNLLSVSLRPMLSFFCSHASRLPELIIVYLSLHFSGLYTPDCTLEQSLKLRIPASVKLTHWDCCSS